MRLKIILAAGLVLVSMAIYWQTRDFGFVNLDDPAYVAGNPEAQRGFSVASVRWAFSTVHLANYAPLTWLTFLADFARAGLDPGAYHLTNAVLHAANAALLFLVLARLTAAPWPSALVAALFAVHPLHVESVAWISSRKDVVSTFFGLAAIGAYGEFVRRRRIAWYAAVLALFVCSLLAKSMWVTLPCVLLLLDFWPLRRAGWIRADARAWLRLVVEKLPMFAIAAASSVVTIYAQREGGAMPGGDVLNLRMRAANAVVSYVRYLLATVWPVDLIPYYTHPKDTVPAWTIAASVVLLVGLTALAWLLRRQRPYVIVGLLWYVGTLVPVIGLVQVGGQAMADRYTYVPLIGLFIAAAWGLADFVRVVPRLRFAAAAACACAVAAFGLLAYQQTARWRDSVTLFEYTLSVDPENSVALGNLGDAYLAAERYDDAAEITTRALTLKPGNLGNLRNLALALRRMGQPDQAESVLRRALEVDPRAPRTQNLLALVLMDRGRWDEAQQALEAALAIDPEVLETHVNLGNLRLRRGDLGGAAIEYHYVLDRHPRDADVLSNLGIVHLMNADYAQAIEFFQRALSIAPRDAMTRTNLAIALLAANKPDEARQAAEDALRDDPNYAKARLFLEDLERMSAEP